jgi:hypothetical protein
MLRKHGPSGFFLIDEEAIVIEWVFRMQECGLSISLHQLKLKVAKLTKNCTTPCKNGIHGTPWWH